MSTRKRRIRVLVVEDSPTVRALLVMVLQRDPGIEVVGQASDGMQAVELTRGLKPDLVTMDVTMPGMDGFAATKEIMVEVPTPIVIISGRADVHEVKGAMQAMLAGALAVLPKPAGPDSPTFLATSTMIVDTVKAMADVKVVRHWRQRRSAAFEPAPRMPLLDAPRAQIVAVATSTGGPAALHSFLSGLPGDFPVPIVIVQHITPGYIEGLATWLNAASSLKVKVAVDGEPLTPHTAYLAPDDHHLGVLSDRTISLSNAPAINGFRPAGTFLFESVARAFGRSTIAVIMTGMGDDGVVGLRAVRNAGGRVIAQDEATSVVFGMPGAAISAGLVDVVLPLTAIVAQIGDRFYQPDAVT